MASSIKFYTNGAWEDAPGRALHPITNPATGEVIAQVPYATAEDVDRTARAAHAAFLKWREVPVVERVQVFYRYKDLLEKHAAEIARILSTENGKTVDDAAGSVRRAIQMVEVACGMPSLMMGQSLENVSKGIDCQTIRQPLGVCAGITPFNFPAMVPMWMFPFAIACGNTFILKPSEKVPLTPTRTAELLHDAGLPAGVYNLLHGVARSGGRAAGASAGARDFVCRIEPGGEVRLSDRRRARQARAGAGRRQESPGGDAGCQHREERGSHHGLGVRRGRRALPGGQRAGGGGRCAAAAGCAARQRCAICASATARRRAPRWGRW